MLNKLVASILVAIGAVPVFVDGDATALVVMLLIGVPMFFSKESWFYSGSTKTVNTKDIYTLAVLGEPVKDIANEYGISRTRVRDICRGEEAVHKLGWTDDVA